MSDWVPRPGIHLVHKPVGATSFELVREATDAAAALGLAKQLPVCHGGALDPFAEGLLLLLIGPATKLMGLVHAAPKSYVAEVAWGAETDSGDHLGTVVQRGDASALTPERLDAALQPMLGEHDQVPPATSNKRVDGERAYVKAHRGEQFELPASRVVLHAARWVAHDLPRASTLELTCGGGYYVRALARDLGRTLGCFAHLRALRRTSIGPWPDPPTGERVWIHGRALLPWLPARELTHDELDRVRRKQPIPRATPDAGPIRALHGDKLVALLRPEGDALEVQELFKTEL